MSETILDIIDSDQIESLLEQHNSYDTGGLFSVSRRDVSRPWYVYYKGTEVNVRLNPHASPMAHRTLREALEVAFSPAWHERMEIYERQKATP